MAVRVKYDVVSELVKPKLEDLKVTNITEKDLQPASTTDQNSNLLANSRTATTSPQQGSSLGYAWDSWSLNINMNSMKAAADAIETFLKQVDKLSKVIVQILKVIRLLSSNEKSIAIFLKFIIKAIAKLLKDLLNAFASTGLYVNVIFPDHHTSDSKYSIPIWGGYQEFIQRVNASCLSTDPSAPNFNSPNDRVGGVILAMLGGVNDTEFLVNLMHNFEILSKFFGLPNIMPSPPRNFKVLSGIYRNNKTSKEEMGVQLSWGSPENPVTRYRIYRSTIASGYMRSPTPILGKVEIPVRILVDNPIFDKKQPYYLTDIISVPGRTRYKYTDFSVKEGTKYYYKVYSMIGDDYFDYHPAMEDIKSPVATAMLSARPCNCIPVSELSKYTILGVNGEFIDPRHLEGDWQSLTVRTLLGKQLDGVFRQIDALTAKIIGLVNTGSSATSDYLDFYAKRVSSLLEIVTKFRALIVEMMSFNLRGTFMCLRLPMQGGGMVNFVDRFNQASQVGNTAPSVKPVRPEDKIPATTTVNGGIAQYTEKGIMFGVIILFAEPDLTDPKRLLQVVGPKDLEKYKTELGTTEKAVSTLMKLLGLG